MFISNPKILVCVCVYTRWNNIQRWLKAWSSCERYNAKLAIIHNYDEAEPDPGFRRVSRVGEPNGQGADFYIPRRNIGQDIGAFQDLCYDRLEGFSETSYGKAWDILFWSADDCFPLKRNFLIYFINRVMSHGIGAAGPHISEEVSYHLRTNCFCIKREIAKQLVFPKDVMETQYDCYTFEHRHNTMTQQLQALGLKVAMPGDGPDATDTNWITWDSGHYGHLNKWEEFFSEFPEAREHGIN